MGLKNQLTKTPYLVLFIVLISIGVGTAYAGIVLPTITFEGLTVFKENAQFEKDVNINGTISGVETLEGLNCTNDQIAKFDGSGWTCVPVVIAAECDPDAFMVGINPDGSIICMLLELITLDSLGCLDGEIAQLDGSVWTCIPAVIADICDPDTVMVGINADGSILGYQISLP